MHLSQTVYANEIHQTCNETSNYSCNVCTTLQCLHNTVLKHSCTPVNAFMFSTNTKKEEQVLFICQLWIRWEVLSSWTSCSITLPQRNLHGQLLMYLRKNNLTSSLDYGGQRIWQKSVTLLSNVLPPLTVATEDYAM